MPRLVDHLPLFKSTRETVPIVIGMSRSRRARFFGTLALTVARPVGRYILESHKGDHPLRPVDTVAGVTLDATDKLDGLTAKYKDHDGLDAVTPLGGEIDPFLDKADFVIQEHSQVERGVLSKKHRNIRFARDVIVTLARSFVSGATNGEANISAGAHGKTSTGIRTVSLRATELPFENEHPDLRQAHQTIATVAIVVSGLLNLVQYGKEFIKYKRNAKKASREEAFREEACVDEEFPSLPQS